ncbi:MoaF-related domain-containing protein [Streptomyces acidicola]|uniref:MoaF-related domain-containing protein n=1 Tax=Streptomyces acidicola TaxID=2596892 RepID=UPI0034234CD2
MRVQAKSRRSGTRWESVAVEQLVGKRYKFNLGALKVRFTFDLQTQGSFVVEEGGGLGPDGHGETVELDLKKIRDGVYLNSWTEARSTTVTHVEDFANGTLHSNVTVGGTAGLDAHSDSEGTSKWGTSP